MDPRVRQVDGHAMVNAMRQNIEIMLRKKKHAVQVRSGVATVTNTDLFFAERLLSAHVE